MKAKDLRIGNFVWVDNKEYHPELVGKTMVVCGIEKLRHDESGKVQLNHVDDMENITLPAVSQFEHFLKPIPITEELLIRLGFTKNHNVLWISMANIKAELHAEIYPSGMVFIIRSDISELVLDPIKYVHELQSLFFVLTAQELELK